MKLKSGTKKWAKKYFNKYKFNIYPIILIALLSFQLIRN